MKNNLIGAGVLLFIVIIAIVYTSTRSKRGSQSKGPKETVTFTGEIGGEKKGFLQNEKVIDFLQRRHGVKLEFNKAGSIEMVAGNIKENLDFLWPSSQVALELFKNLHAAKYRKSEIIFNSPIVLYSWDIVTEALINNGIVKKIDNTYYIIDFPKLIKLVMESKKWADIGITDLYGKISIISTHPAKSNSGNMFAGLLANILHGDVVDNASITKHLPDIKSFFDKLGYLEHSSGDLFSQYLKMGVGSKPIIVGYENQIIEFSVEHKKMWPKIKDKIRILYPVPTVWSSHPLILLNKKSNRLLTALSDAGLMKIAWETHGFRTGMAGVENDVSMFKAVGIPETIKKVIPMPSPDVMNKIIETVNK